MPSKEPFHARWSRLAKDLSPLCVGLDPAPATLAAWGLDETPDGVRRFCLSLLDACEGHVAVVKPQVAFFEAFGPAGFEVLAEVMEDARRRGILVIADVKRGDIGTSTAAYARAWLETSGSGFRADAITAHAYLGVEALRPLFDTAAANGGTVFVVVRSSNPEGAGLQNADHSGRPVADVVADGIAKVNHAFPGEVPASAVMGATLGEEAKRTLALMPKALFLVPGLGAQGASLDDIASLFGSAADRAIPTASRSVAHAGPDAAALRSAVATLAREARRLQG
ncbi:orotidine-5'-phosphate decarboxylase [Consotaella salsifontis]|uniref:Orotidine 5'-phosphate decarboxylase n=1 Tax=Consotaella salsifontis TaxID=1365950 RepID=A0A1T4LGH3_9HYPH|nr:orotidine-5'-phosphate decarboxylase [Consotaella salsifontis]SJZ53760.1 orotidine-5'-phosphate decarboxylase [Consotaella salsifontis]